MLINKTNNLHMAKLSICVLTIAGHNVRRCRHGLSDLKWDDGLVKVAKAHAAKCVYKHSK